MARSSALVLLCLLGFVPSAQANTQTVADPNDSVAVVEGRHVDPLQAELSQGEGQTWVDVTIEPQTLTVYDSIWVGFDTNFDGTADYVARLTEFDASPARVTVHATTASNAACQQLGTETLAATDVAITDPLVLPVHIPTSAIGGAASYRWAVYALTYSNSHNAFDYVPDAANPDPARSNPVTTVNDRCADGRETNGLPDAAVPLKMSGGTAYPAEPGGGGGSGGSSGAGPGGANPFVPDPVLVAIPAPETLRTIKFPRVTPGTASCRGRICTVLDVQSLLRKRGLRNYRLVLGRAAFDDVPRAYKSRIEDGDVVLQSPAVGTKVGEPNVAAYPDAALPKVKLDIWREPQLEHGCTENGLEGVLKGMAWPGETTGTGNKRVRGAQDILEKLRCEYRLTYTKKAGTTQPTIDKVSAGSTVRLRIALPKTMELSVLVTEGTEIREVTKQKLPGPDAGGRMPVTGKGQGIVVARVLQTSSVPSIPAPAGVDVLVNGPTGSPVAIGRTTAGGYAVLRGHFTSPGTHRLIAVLAGANGLTLDGEGSFQVAKLKSPLTTAAGRRFRFEDGRWKFLTPAGKVQRGAVARPAQFGSCEVTAANRDSMAAYVASLMRDSVEQLGSARTLAERQTWTGHFVNRYLGAREADLLRHAALQQLLSSLQISVPNLGGGALKPVTSLCALTTAEQARRQVRGFSLNGPLPVIATAAGLGLPDGTTIRPADFTFSSADFVFAPAARAPGELVLSLDERTEVVQALIGQAGGNLAARLGPAIKGVISTGGGNVISTGGGNVVATRPRLTSQQLRMIFAVISTGGGNVISTGGGNLTTAEKAAVQAVISTGGGNLIGQAGGNMTDNQIRAMLRIISNDGASLISDKGLGLTSGEINAVQAVISTGGGNVTADVLRDALYGVISTGGGNIASQTAADVVGAVISTGGGNLIGQAGGNLKAKEVLAAFAGSAGLTRLSQVISTGGGNVQALIGQAGGNLISDKGLG